MGRSLLKWGKRVVVVGVVSGVALGALGMTWQVRAEANDARKFPPPGEFVDMGGYRLHLLRKGHTGPTVVFEAGLGCNHMDWTRVQDQLSKEAITISYDRGGYGWSDPILGNEPRDSSHEIDELHLLLQKSGAQAPYYLIGHSFGGLNIRLFASRYPNEVAGLLFVDSCHEEQVQRMGEDEAPSGLAAWTAWDNAERGRWLTRFGMTRFFLPYTDAPEKLNKAFPEKKQEYLATVSTQKFANVNYEETLLFGESCEQVKQAQWILKDIPIVVLTAGVPPGQEDSDAPEEDKKINRIWNEMHLELKNLSTRSVQMHAEKSDHMIPWQQPEKVVDAFHKLIQISNS